MATTFKLKRKLYAAVPTATMQKFANKAAAEGAGFATKYNMGLGNMLNSIKGSRSVFNEAGEKAVMQLSGKERLAELGKGVGKVGAVGAGVAAVGAKKVDDAANGIG